jgi:hypothetical protein
MDTINVCLGIFSVHHQLKINFKADFSRSENIYIDKKKFAQKINKCLSDPLIQT